jgi:hypothetical protein
MSETENNPIPPNASARPSVRPKPKPLESLPEFLTAAKASPKPFLVFTRKHPPVSLSDFDIHELGVFLDTHDKAVLRLTALLAGLPDEQSVIARQVTQVAEAYARRQVPSMVWPQLRPETSGQQIKDVIRALLSAEREPQKRKKGQTAAYFVLWVARLRGALDGESLIELLLFAFPPRLKGRAKAVQVRKPDLGSILAPLLHKKAARDIALAVAIYHITKAADATEASRAQAAAVEKLKQEIALHEKTISSLTEQAAQNGLVLKQKDADIAQLTKDIADHRAVARQAMQRLKARLNGLLQGELLPMLRDIHDSSTMEPVRTHVILDRIETARKLIEKESQWLESSD